MKKYFVGLCKKIGKVCVFLAKTKPFFGLKSLDKNNQMLYNTIMYHNGYVREKPVF